jgi:hypothetical protein
MSINDLTLYYQQYRKRWQQNSSIIYSNKLNPEHLKYKIIDDSIDELDSNDNFVDVCVAIDDGELLGSTKQSFHFSQNTAIINQTNQIKQKNFQNILNNSNINTNAMYHPLLNPYFCHVGVITFHEAKTRIDLPMFEFPNFHFPIFWEAIILNEEQQLEIIALDIKTLNSNTQKQININQSNIYALRIGILKINNDHIISDTMLQAFSRCVERYARELNTNHNENTNSNFNNLHQLEWISDAILTEKNITITQLKKWQELMNIQFNLTIHLTAQQLNSYGFEKNTTYTTSNIWEYKQIPQKNEYENELETPQGFIYCIYEEASQKLSFHPALTSSVIIVIIDQLLATSPYENINNKQQLIDQWSEIKEHLMSYYDSLKSYGLFAGYGLTNFLFM